VAHGVGVHVRVEDRLHRRGADAPVAAEVAKRDGARLARRVGDPVHLDPVARGQDQRLLHDARRRDVAQELAELVLFHGELLA